MPTLARTVLTAAVLSVSLTAWAAAAPPEPNLPEGYRADSEAVERTLARSLALYRSARTMRFSVERTTENTVRCALANAVSTQRDQHTREIAYQSADRWAIVSDNMARHREGDCEITAYPQWCQYIEFPRGREPDRAYSGLPERLFLLPDETGPNAFGNGFEPVGIREAPHEGRDAVWIFGAAAMEPGAKSSRTLTLVFDRETALLLMTEKTMRMIVRLSDEQSKERRQRFHIHTIRAWRYITTALDEPVTDEQLAFRPEYHGVPLVRVSSFVHPWLVPYEIDREEMRAQPPVDFEATTLDGRVVRLSDFRGRVVVLVFWASWCGPCIRDMPGVQQAFERAAGLPVIFLGVNVDSTEEGLAKARELVERHRVSFLQALDPERKIAAHFAVHGYPTHVVLDREGKFALHQFSAGPHSDYALKLVLEAPPREPGATTRLGEVRAVAAALEAAKAVSNDGK